MTGDRPSGVELVGADSEPSYGGGLSAHATRQYPKEQAVNVTFQKSASVPTAESECDGTFDSADACWRPRGQNNTGTPYTVEDRGNGSLAPPAVHRTDAVGLPVPERCGSPVTGLRT